MRWIEFGNRLPRLFWNRMATESLISNTECLSYGTTIGSCARQAGSDVSPVHICITSPARCMPLIDSFIVQDINRALTRWFNDRHYCINASDRFGIWSPRL